jgi:hypothetical protein
MARLALPDFGALGARIAGAWRRALGAPEARDVFGLVPLMWGLCLSIHAGPMRVDLAPFLLPLAVWLGAARGRAGVMALALGAAPLLVSIRAEGAATGYAPPGFYFALLLVARFAADRAMRAASFRADGVAPSEMLFLAGTLALAPYFDLTSTVRFGLDFRDFVVVACFFVGLSRIAPAAVLGPLALAAALSLVVTALRSPHAIWTVGPLGLYATFASTRFLFAIVAAFAAGRVFRRCWARRGTPDPVLAAWLLAAAVVSCGLSGIGWSLQGPLSAEGAEFRLFLGFGSAQATAALLFAAGLAGGSRAAAVAAVLWIVVLWVGPLVAVQAGLIGGVEAGAGSGRMPSAFDVSMPLSLLGPTVEAAPGVRAGGLDFLFASFGWRLAAMRATPRRVDGTRGHRPAPVLRVTAFHRALHYVAWLGFAWVGAGFLLSLMAALGFSF